MRKVYLVRHAQPAFPGNDKYCIGQTDFPLSPFGILQSHFLAHWTKELFRDFAVFSSRLTRAAETAACISSEAIIVDGLEEMHAGEWDGLSFSQIQEGWPDIFLRRGEDRNIPIPGAEDVNAGLERFKNAVETCLSLYSRDIVIVAHSTVIQALISHAAKTDPYESRAYRLPYCSVTTLTYDGDFRLEAFGGLPELSYDNCAELHRIFCGNDKIFAHCAAVSRKAEEICRALGSRGISLDWEIIGQAALLHDIARCEDNHPRQGAKWLNELGYPAHAEIIRQHHDLEDTDITEAAVVYIADKCIKETSDIGIEERFRESAEKCSNEHACEMHMSRYLTAKRLKDKINTLYGGELIK